MTTTRRILSRSALIALTVLVMVSGAVPAHAGPEDDARALLTAVDNVVAVGISPTQIYVQWDPPTLRPVATYGYRVEMATDEEGPYIDTGAVASCSTVCATTVGASPASDPVPRWVRVIPILVGAPPKNDHFNPRVPVLEGAPSKPDPAILASAAPTNLRCNGNLSCVAVTSIELTWRDNSDEYQFWIYRARATNSSGNPTWSTTPYAQVSANTTRYLESGLDLEKQFFYKVVAVRYQQITNAQNETLEEYAYSDATGPDKIRVETPKIPAPLDPTGLTTVFQAPNKAVLTWSDIADDEDGYYVEWGPNCSKFEYMTALPPRDGTGATSWTDPNLPADTGRCYRVRGYRFGPAYSRYTNNSAVGSPPIAPSSLRVTSFTNAAVSLAWRDNSQAEDHFSVQRCNGLCTSSTPAASWTEVGTVPADDTTMTDATTTSLTTYSYRVRAGNSSGMSPPSNIVNVTTLPSPIPAPRDLIATATGSHANQVQFKDQSSNETGFRVEYKNFDGEWESLLVLSPKPGTGGLVVAVDTISLPANTQRCYRARAFRPGEVSDPSNQDCATTLPPQVPNGTPGQPSGTAVNSSRIDLTWMDNSTNEESFKIYARAYSNELCAGTMNPTGELTTLVGTAPARGGAGPGLTSFSVNGLLPHTAYFFQIIAVNQDGVSPRSPISACVSSFGPPRPVFSNPTADGDFEVTRCDVTITAPASKVDRMKLLVVANLPGAGPYNVDTLWKESPTAANRWTFSYQFRKGVNYGLLATSYGDWVDPSLRYPSVEVRLRDITVAADCPTGSDDVEPDPIP